MILGSYEVLSELGSGTFGTVLRVKDTRSGEVVAMKCISKNKIQRNKMGDQVKKEINTMKVLRHPNIVQIRDVLMDKTYLYITMDYVSGGELYMKIASRGRMSEKVARGYFAQVMEAVKYCHGLNICHRDIKPENILIDDNDTVKIADFGFASIMEVDDYKKPSGYMGQQQTPGSEGEEGGGRHEIDEFIMSSAGSPAAPIKDSGFQRLESKIMRRLSTVCGTSLYMAPEISKHTGYFGDKADVWSCGVVLYYLLMSSLPFGEGAFDSVPRFPPPGSTSTSTPTSTYKLSSNLSDDVRDLLANLLMYDPRARFSARRALTHRWFRGEVSPGMKGPGGPELPVGPVRAEPALSIIAETDDAEVEDACDDSLIPKTISSTLGVAACVSKAGDALKTLGWTHSPLSEQTTSIKASTLSDTGMVLIQLDFQLKEISGVTEITIDVFGEDDGLSEVAEARDLMKRIREYTSPP